MKIQDAELVNVSKEKFDLRNQIDKLNTLLGNPTSNTNIHDDADDSESDDINAEEFAIELEV